MKTVCRKKLLWTATTALLLATSGAAQAVDWTGGYGGLNVGATTGTASAQTSTPYNAFGYFDTNDAGAINRSGSQDISTSGFMGGAQAGYNYQSGKIVYGIQLGLDSLSAKSDQTTVGNYPDFAFNSYSIHQSVSMEWMVSVLPRIGFTTGNSLFYVDAGIVGAEVKYSEQFSDNLDNASESSSGSHFQFGGAVGAGLDYRLSPRLTISPQYTYFKLSSFSTPSNGLFTNNGLTYQSLTTVNHSVSMSDNLFVIGVNYNF